MKPIIIPINVEVFLSGKAYTKKPPRWYPDYTKIKNSSLGKNISPAAFSEYNTFLKSGCHIHFILPDAFTIANCSNDIYEFSSVPNRYVVTRIWKKDDKIHTKAFIIESDALQTDDDIKGQNPEDYTVIPYLDDKVKPYRFLGRSYMVGEESKSNGYVSKLTAVMAGDPLFYCYYPTCRSVFGFHDHLTDVDENSDISYFVVGYFKDGINDPFSDVKTKEDFNTILENFSFKASDNIEFSDNCLLYGQVVNIKWYGENYDYNNHNIEPINVSFGNTSTESLSCILAQNVLKDEILDKDLEHKLLMLQYDLIKEENQIDANFKIDDEIHKRVFKYLDPLEEYDEIVLNQENLEEDNEGLSNNKEILDFTKYHELRALQKKQGTINREIYYTKKKLYNTWEIYITRYESYSPDVLEALNEVKSILNDLTKKDGLLEQSKKIEEDINLKRNEVIETLPKNYELKKVTEDGFVIPREPTLMLSGKGINRTFLFGEDTKEELLYCQIETQKSDELTWETLKELCVSLPEYEFSFDYERLLYQALLNTPFIIKDFKDVKILGSISKIAINENPLEIASLFMDWQLDYYYTSDIATLVNWSIEYSKMFYDYKGELPSSMTSVNGRMVLTPHALYLLAAKLNEYSEGSIVRYDKISNLTYISQELSGYTNELTGLRQVFQMPLFIDENEISKEVEKYILEDRLAVSSSKLYPIRMGLNSLSKLNVVSTFGEVRTVAENGIYNKAKAYFPYYMNVYNNNTKALFPLVLSSPSRLSFHFVSSNNDSIRSTCAPDSSPIVGLILPELLNNRLLVYNEYGEYAGMLKIIIRDKKLKNIHIKPSVMPQLNYILEEFIKSILDNDYSLSELSTLIQETLNKTIRTCSKDFIFGLPIAIARLEGKLEFYGKAEYSKTKEDFKKYNDKGLSELKIPLMFGNINRVSDGTIGVFEDLDFTKFHALYGADSTKYSKYVTTTLPKISESDQEKYFTCLIIPKNEMNIETKLLPICKIQIESIHTNFHENIIPQVEINPIITNEEMIKLPNIGNNFKYIYKVSTSKWIEKDIYTNNEELEKTIIIDGYLKED